MKRRSLIQSGRRAHKQRKAATTLARGFLLIGVGTPGKLYHPPSPGAPGQTPRLLPACTRPPSVPAASCPRGHSFCGTQGTLCGLKGLHLDVFRTPEPGIPEVEGDGPQSDPVINHVWLLMQWVWKAHSFVVRPGKRYSRYSLFPSPKHCLRNSLPCKSETILSEKTKPTLQESIVLARREGPHCLLT